MTDYQIKPIEETAVAQPNTGGLSYDLFIASMLNEKMATGGRSFEISWYGSRVPAGAVVDGQTIHYTKGGIVYGEEEEMIGSYERVVDYEKRADGYFSQMIVTLWARNAADQDGQP